MQPESLTANENEGGDGGRGASGGAAGGRTPRSKGAKAGGGPTGGGLSYELALKLCDDRQVIQRLHAQFAARAMLLLQRIEESVAEGSPAPGVHGTHTRCAEWHSTLARRPSHWRQTPSSAANVANVPGVRQCAEWLANEVKTLGTAGKGAKLDGGKRGERSKGGSERVSEYESDKTDLDDDARAEQLINALARRNIQSAVDRLAHAAARHDIQGLYSGALALKQMTLCHGHAFDLLAITAYRLQQACAEALDGGSDVGKVRTDNATAKAMASVLPVLEAGMHTGTLLLLEANESGDGEQPITSLRQLIGCSFFSHVICIKPDAAFEVSVGLDPYPVESVPPISPDAVANFSGDQVVLAHTASALLSCCPRGFDRRSVPSPPRTWCYSDPRRGSCTRLPTSSETRRLAQLAAELIRLISGSAAPLQNAHKVLVRIEAEAKLVLAYFAQARRTAGSRRQRRYGRWSRSSWRRNRSSS